jgi:hypothetical protein
MKATSYRNYPSRHEVEEILETMIICIVPAFFIAEHMPNKIWISYALT